MEFDEDGQVRRVVAHYCDKAVTKRFDMANGEGSDRDFPFIS